MSLSGVVVVAVTVLSKSWLIVVVTVLAILLIVVGFCA